MTTLNLLEILVYLGLIVAIMPIIGGYMKAGLLGREDTCSTRCSADRARSVPNMRRRCRARPDLGRVDDRHARRQRRIPRDPVPHAAARIGCR